MTALRCAVSQIWVSRPLLYLRTADGRENLASERLFKLSLNIIHSSLHAYCLTHRALNRIMGERIFDAWRMDGEL